MISQQEMLDQVIPLMKSKGLPYKKFKSVFAREAKAAEVIVTITSDGIETTNRAEEGDYIVKNQTDAGESYIMNKKKFTDRYDFLKKSANGLSEYKPKGKIIGLEMTTNLLKSFDFTSTSYFEAPWGEPMVIKEDDFLACPPDYSEVYRIARKEFFETYELEG